MKMFIEKAREVIKLRCQVKTNNVRDHSLDFVRNLAIHSMNTRPDMAAIFNSETNGKFINMQDGFWHNMEPGFLAADLVID